MAFKYCGTVLILCLLVVFLSISSADIFRELRTDYTTQYFANKFGYEYEEYTAVTPDKYHLTIHRIKPKKVAVQFCPPIFFMHGILGASSNFNFWNKSSAYYFADQGCDVFLGNARGNQYSSKHDSLSIYNPSYWSFSWDEIALLDLPTMIDLVLEITGQEKLAYIGHSQGTTTFFALNSEKPDYVKQKILSAHMLSPVVYMEHIQGILAQLANVVSLFSNPLANYISAPFLPNTVLSKLLAKPLCEPELDICENLLNLFFGPSENFEHSIMVDMRRIMPAGSSFNQVHQFAQLVRNGGFCKYDLGHIGNFLKYHSLTPPDYPLTQVQSTIFLYCADKDYLSQMIDVDRLLSVVNVTDFHFFPNWAHLDYLTAKNIDTELNPLLYQNVLKFI